MGINLEVEDWAKSLELEKNPSQESIKRKDYIQDY